MRPFAGTADEQNAAGYAARGCRAASAHGYQSYDRGCEAREALVGEGAGGSAGGFGSPKAINDCDGGGWRRSASRRRTVRSVQRRPLRGEREWAHRAAARRGRRMWPTARDDGGIWVMSRTAAGRGYPDARRARRSSARAGGRATARSTLLELVNRHKRNHVTAHGPTTAASFAARTHTVNTPAARCRRPPHYTVPGKHGSSTRDEAHYCYKPAAPMRPWAGSRAFRAHAAVADAANATLSANGGAAVAAVGARAAWVSPPRRRRNDLAAAPSRRIAGRALSQVLAPRLPPPGSPPTLGPLPRAATSRRSPRCTRKSPPLQGGSAPTAPSARSSARARRTPVSWSWAERTVKTQNTINWLWSSLAGEVSPATRPTL